MSVGWARVVLDPADADGETTLTVEDAIARCRRDIVAELDAAISDLGLDAQHARSLRAAMLARVDEVCGPKLAAWAELVRARLVVKAA